jgi:HEAT repeat protein
VYALGRIGPAAEAARGALIQLLSDRERSVRSEVAKALGLIGPAGEVVPALFELQADPHADVRIQATEALRRVAGAAAVLAGLTKLLVHQNKDVRLSAAAELGRIGPPHEIVSALSELVTDPDADVRVLATELLSQVGRTAEWPALIQLLAEGGSEVQALAAAELGKRGPAGEFVVSTMIKLVPVLIKVLADGNGSESNRRNAAECLGKLGPLAQAAVPTLTRLLTDENEGVRKAAAEALKQIEGT